MIYKLNSLGLLGHTSPKFRGIEQCFKYIWNKILHPIILGCHSTQLFIFAFQPDEFNNELLNDIENVVNSNNIDNVLNSNKMDDGLLTWL